MPTFEYPLDLGEDLLSSVIARAEKNSVIIVQVGNDNHCFIGNQRETEQLRKEIEHLTLKNQNLEEMNSKLMAVIMNLSK